MCCAVAAKVVQRKKAYPSVHDKGTIWADKHTRPINKIRNRETKKKKKSGDSKDDFKITETEDIALRNEIRRALQNVNQRKMKAILPHLRSVDKANKGKITFAIVRQTLQMNQISLSESGFRNLGKKFGEKEDDTHVVIYEKLVSYLTKLWAEAAALPKMKPTTPPAAGFSNSERISDRRSYVTRPSYVGNDPYSLKGHNRATFVDVDEAQLLVDLQRNFANLLSMAKLKKKMYKLDEEENGFLSEGQVFESFRSCGVYLSPEVFQQLLSVIGRTSSNTYSIEAIINYLLIVRPDLQYEVYSEDRWNQSTYPTEWEEVTPYDTEELEEDFDDLLNNDYDAEDESFDVTEWSKQYQVMVGALHKADEDKTGFLNEDEVRRIAKTYILVHNLQVSDTDLSSAIKNAYDSTVREVNLDQFSNLLEEYHFNYVRNNLL